MPKTLRDLLLDALRDAYSAEQQLLNALPELAKAAKSSELRKLFKDHIATANGHVDRLCDFFEEVSQAPEGKVSLPMEGLVMESQKLAQEGLEPDILDVALIASAHKIAHYEMAAYGNLCGYADALGFGAAAKEFRASLSEEKKFNDALTAINQAKRAKTKAA